MGRIREKGVFLAYETPILGVYEGGLRAYGGGEEQFSTFSKRVVFLRVGAKKWSKNALRLASFWVKFLGKKAKKW